MRLRRTRAHPIPLARPGPPTALLSTARAVAPDGRSVPRQTAFASAVRRNARATWRADARMPLPASWRCARRPRDRTAVRAVRFAQATKVCLDYYQAGVSPALDLCQPWSAGVLFAQNGAADRVHYSDFASWTGADVPRLPCPATTGGAVLCGGSCGECPSSETCTGRSPLHPFGWCTTRPLSQCSPGKLKCSYSNYACFTYAVQSGAQAYADSNGYCLPPALCDALAAQLPGGATCTH